MARYTAKQYLEWALEFAARSPDTSSQNGAIIVDIFGNIIGSGCNTFCHGVARHPERFERPAKYDYFEHAERNAIYHAARHGKSTDCATMYCPWAACRDCARAIIQSGITTLVRKNNLANPERWAKSCEVGDMQLREAGVQIIEFEEQISNIQILRDGELITP